MKNIVTFLLLALFAVSFTYAEECTPGDARKIEVDNLGAFKPAEGEKCFENVYNSGSADLVAGNIVTLDESEESPFKVEISAAAGAIPRCVLVEACAQGALCKCQTYGYNDVALEADTWPSVGDMVFIDETSAGYLGLNASSDPDVDTPVGYALEDGEDSGALKVFLKLR